LREKNRTPVDDPEHILVTNGGIHGIYLVCRALLEPGDEVLVPDPLWPAAAGNVLAARATPVSWPLQDTANGWRYDIDGLAARITPRTRAIYLNSPHNPTGAVLSRDDTVRIAGIAQARQQWVLSDEAYEDVLYAGEHVSIASLPGMYERTIPMHTYLQQVVRDDRTAPRIRRDPGSDNPRPGKEDSVLHREQHLVGGAVRRYWCTRRSAGFD
jgi:aspartate aminotransferase